VEHCEALPAELEFREAAVEFALDRFEAGFQPRDLAVVVAERTIPC
jgi:hypothetical protein